MAGAAVAAVVAGACVVLRGSELRICLWGALAAWWLVRWKLSQPLKGLRCPERSCVACSLHFAVAWAGITRSDPYSLAVIAAAENRERIPKLQVKVTVTCREESGSCESYSDVLTKSRPASMGSTVTT